MIGDACEGATGRWVFVAPLLSNMQLLKLGVERELARAECGQRIHCLVYVVALDGSSLPNSLQHFHLVIAAKSYQFKPIKIQ
jgi:hypothetical protein